MKELLSTKNILIAVLVLIIVIVVFGGDDEEPKRVTYNQSSVPIGVSNQLSSEAIDKLGVDLTENLDPKLIPALTEEALKETSQAGVSEEEFMQTLVSKISNKIQDISTIDLNQDGITDPVFVLPQTESGGEEFLVFSILVPDPAEVKKLPSGGDQDEWRDIIENKSIEIMTTSVVRGTEEEVTMQSAPNPQMYQSAGAPYPPYYSTGPSMTSILMTSMMMSMLFQPPYPYRGFGGGPGYSQRTVTSVQNSRDAKTSSLSKASGSSSAATTKSGKSVSANKFRATPKKSLNNIKSSKFKANNAAKRRASGGFGSSAKKAAPKKPAVRKAAPTRKKSIFGGSRRSSRRSGGFGRRKR